MNAPWFYWAISGVALIGLEMVVPGFVIFFFGVGALLTALSSLIPPIGQTIWIQISLFIVFSILSLVFLRRNYSIIFAGTVFDSRKPEREEAGNGKIAKVTETASVLNEGRIRFQGTTWKAIAKSGECKSGTLARIVSRDGITYVIESIPETEARKGESK
jgi:inner membrane protein